MKSLLLGTIFIWTVVMAVWVFDRRPVQRSLSRQVIPPATTTVGEAFQVIHRVIRLRPCETRSVEHFLLAKTSGRTWLLRRHSGEQRYPSRDPHEYITTLEWPAGAPAGRYQLRLVLKFSCHPLRLETVVHETDFEVR